MEQLFHRGSEENCFGERSYNLVQNRWNELKIKHYLWPHVQFEFTPGSLLNSECNQRQFLQHYFKLHYEEFDPKSTKNCISTRMLQSLHPTMLCLQHSLEQVVWGETVAFSAKVGVFVIALEGWHLVIRWWKCRAIQQPSRYNIAALHCCTTCLKMLLWIQYPRKKKKNIKNQQNQRINQKSEN